MRNPFYIIMYLNNKKTMIVVRMDTQYFILSLLIDFRPR